VFGGFTASSLKTVVRNEVRVPEREDNKGTFCVVLDNMFTGEECDALIRLAEANVFEEAHVNVGNDQSKLIPELRNNWRTMLRDEEIARLLWDRVSGHVPTEYKDRKAVELNEQLRCLRYDDGQKFEAHCDGSWERPAGEKKGDSSLLTFQLYLNENFGEGSTRFLEENDVDGVDVFPKIGRVCIFDHYIVHKGCPPTEGRKYAIRTDIMFR